MVGATFGIANSAWASWGAMIGGSLVSLLMLYHATDRYLLARKIESTPTSKVSEVMREGLVEVYGKARAIEPMVAPLSGKNAVYWSVKAVATEHTRRAKQTTSKDTVIYSDKVQVPFFLEDDTGKILVDPAGADVIIIPGDDYRKGDPAARKFIQGLSAEDQEDFKRHDSVSIEEESIAEGQDVYVLGLAKQSAEYGVMAIQKGGERVMLVTNRTEKQITKDMKFITWLLLFIAIFVICAAYYIAHSACPTWPGACLT